jgi:hypothetical protein
VRENGRTFPLIESKFAVGFDLQSCALSKATESGESSKSIPKSAFVVCPAVKRGCDRYARSGLQSFTSLDPVAGALVMVDDTESKVK